MKKRTPSLRHHKASGQAVVTLTDADTGRRQDIYLGEHGDTQAHRRYAEVVADWRARGDRLAQPAPREQAIAKAPTENSVAALCLSYMRHREQKGGICKAQLDCIRSAVRIARVTCGHLPVGEFGPLALQQVRDAMLSVRYGKARKRWKRTTVNRRVDHVVGMVKWAVSKERAPIHLPAALECVKALRVGEFGVVDGEKVRPVAEGDIEAIRPHVSTVVWSMIQVQRYSAARPGEVVIMRAVDLDTTASIWAYRPTTHKNEHRGHDRTVYLGKRSQRAVAPLLATRPVDAYLFDPRESCTERARATATKGKPRRAGQKPSARITARKVRNHYTVDSYRKAIHRACTKAGIPRWNPNQLRHNAATAAKAAFDGEAAQLVLGDKSSRMVDTYAERDAARTIAVIQKIG